MPYAIELERDADRGLDRYRIAVSDGFDCADAYRLSEWMDAAAQNPTAIFAIDVSRITAAGRAPLATLLARSAWLRARQRLATT
jgi:hypothetical protein